jgi:hypothetical protein
VFQVVFWWKEYINISTSKNVLKRLYLKPFCLVIDYQLPNLGLTRILQQNSTIHSNCLQIRILYSILVLYIIHKTCIPKSAKPPIFIAISILVRKYNAQCGCNAKTGITWPARKYWPGAMSWCIIIPNPKRGYLVHHDALCKINTCIS